MKNLCYGYPRNFLKSAPLFKTLLYHFELVVIATTHIAQKVLKYSSGAPNPPRFFLIQKCQDQKFLRNTFLTLPQDSNPIFIRRSNLLRKIVLRMYLGSHVLD